MSNYSPKQTAVNLMSGLLVRLELIQRNMVPWSNEYDKYAYDYLPIKGLYVETFESGEGPFGLTICVSNGEGLVKQYTLVEDNQFRQYQMSKMSETSFFNITGKELHIINLSCTFDGSYSIRE